MEITTIADLIANYGMAFVLMAYFLVKDWKQSTEIVATLNSIKEVLAELKTWHAREDNDIK